MRVARKRKPQTPVTPAQIADILRVSEIGAQWVAGKITIEQVEATLGKIKQYNINSQTFYYYDGGGFGADFELNEEAEAEQTGMGRKFEIGPESWMSASIPREIFEQRLGLHRKQPGELIDGARKEETEYLRLPIFDTQDPDEVGLNLRLPMPNDSPFDVHALFVYRVIPEQPAEAKFETTTNFRSFKIYRRYLMPEQLEERNHAKRLKYGAMNLRSGMMCPETGWWQVWLDKDAGEDATFWNATGYEGSGAVDLRFAGDSFPIKRLLKGGQANASYTWVKPFRKR